MFMHIRGPSTASSSAPMPKPATPQQPTRAAALGFLGGAAADDPILGMFGPGDGKTVDNLGSKATSSASFRVECKTMKHEVNMFETGFLESKKMFIHYFRRKYYFVSSTQTNMSFFAT